MALPHQSALRGAQPRRLGVGGSLDLIIKQAAIEQVRSFGNCPTQLFVDTHLKRPTCLSMRRRHTRSSTCLCSREPHCLCKWTHLVCGNCAAPMSLHLANCEEASSDTDSYEADEVNTVSTCLHITFIDGIRELYRLYAEEHDIEPHRRARRNILLNVCQGGKGECSFISPLAKTFLS